MELVNDKVARAHVAERIDGILAKWNMSSLVRIGALAGAIVLSSCAASEVGDAPGLRSQAGLGGETGEAAGAAEPLPEPVRFAHIAGADVEVASVSLDGVSSSARVAVSGQPIAVRFIGPESLAILSETPREGSLWAPSSTWLITAKPSS